MQMHVMLTTIKEEKVQDLLGKVIVENISQNKN